MRDTPEPIGVQSIILRQRLAAFALTLSEAAEEIPPGWSNNIRWHIGHLATTPHRLTTLLLDGTMAIPPLYSTLFAKGTSPRDWVGLQVPSLETLCRELVDGQRSLYQHLDGRWDESFPVEYTTSVGIILQTPREGLAMSYMHDGIHLGLMMALKRALGR
ncbi:MAG: hypothetical protein SF028_00040 [Candidatus Sumerlaeia bacterium]|nr:hypothetical protein [Candidatus Sumerlaeia bacterium]